MEDGVGGEESSEHIAQAAAGPSTQAHESRTIESQESEEERVRTDQHNVTQQTDLTHDDDTVEGGDAPQQAEQQEEVGEHGAHTPQQVQTPTIESDAADQHLQTFLASAAVNDGHEGRALRGASKRGGYETKHRGGRGQGRKRDRGSDTWTKTNAEVARRSKGYGWGQCAYGE